MAIFRAKTKEDIAQEIVEFGAEQARKKVKVIDVTYQSEDLARMIVEAWTDEDFFKDLTEGSWTEAVITPNRRSRTRGIFLSKAGVITEKEYNRRP